MNDHSYAKSMAILWILVSTFMCGGVMFGEHDATPEQTTPEQMKCQDLYFDLHTDRYMGPGDEVWALQGEARKLDGGTELLLIVQSMKDGRVVVMPRAHFETTFERLR